MTLDELMQQYPRVDWTTRTSRRGNLVVNGDGIKDYGCGDGLTGYAAQVSIWAVVNPTTRVVIEYCFESLDEWAY